VLVEKARGDERVVAAAAVGSSAVGGDRWSDLDLTFGVRDGVAVQGVLADWTRTMVEEFAAVELFDLPFMTTIYRVFLVPGALQVDLSFTPAAEFGARGARFQVLFGEAVELPFTPAAPAAYQFGLGVHHVVRGLVCIERGRLWQAEYWISAIRDQALTLACYRLGLETSYGRGFDSLPVEVTEALMGSLMSELSVDGLRRALAVATAGLLREAGDGVEAVGRVRALLADVVGSQWLVVSSQ
jgi:hypothetical protein